MTRDDIINSLDDWKKDADPENRRKHFAITKFGNKNGEFEHVSILLDQKSHSFDFTLNEHNNVIIENFDSPIFSGFIAKNKFREYLFGL